MRRALVTLIVLVVGLVAMPSNTAFAQGVVVAFNPPEKYAVVLLSSYDETNVDTNLEVGQNAANERRAQGFKSLVSRKVARVSLWLNEVGAPTDDLTVQIQTDSGGVPSGTLVTNGASGAVRDGYGETNVDTDLAVGDTAENERRAQGFMVVTDRSIGQVRLRLKRSGTPTDNLRVEIQTDSGGLPSGTVVTDGASGDVPGSGVSVSYGWVSFNFSIPPQLTAGTQYHLVLKRSGSVDAANYYLWGADQSLPGYAGGAGSVYGGTWQATSPATDHAFRVTPTSTSYGWVAFDFSAPPQLTAGTQYHLVLKRSGSVDAANYYVWGADQSSPGYADGAASIYGGSWQATSPATDHAFQVRPAVTVDVYARDVETTEPCIPPDYMQACGLGGYQFEVHFDPGAMKYVSAANGSWLTSTGRSIWSCFNPLGHDPAAGVLTYTCTTTPNPPGGATPFGPEGSGVLATITFIPLIEGTTDLQFQESILPDAMGDAIPHTSENGSVTLGSYGAVDSDGDGCADIEEAGDDPMLGGDRNPFFAYDFYDVPVPANSDPTPSGPRSKAVTMPDVLAVLFYVGARANYPPNANGVDYDSLKDGDWNEDTVVDDGDKVGLRYDRSASWPWSGAPSGAINMGDVLAALDQVGHSCSAPP
jgi:hypothetical protein